METMFISPQWAEDNKNLVCIQTTRMGGESLGNFYSLNLGLSSGDNKDLVLKNRELIFNKLNIDVKNVCLAKQTHSDHILVTNTGGAFNEYDAIISTQPGVFAAVSIADCTPVIVVDFNTKIVAAIHAGWRGTQKEIVSKTIQQMIKLGCKSENLKAFIGACISYNQFEVGPEVASLFDRNFVRKHTNEGKFLIDLKGINARQLIDNGVKIENIEISDYCTITDNHLFYSYRNEKGITGRMMAVVGFR